MPGRWCQKGKLTCSAGRPVGEGEACDEKGERLFYEFENEDALVGLVTADAPDDKPKPLPTRDEFAAAILATASTVQNKGTALDYYKLAAEVLGFIGKNAAAPVQPGPTTLRVMRVPYFGNQEETDQRIAEQQARLVERMRAEEAEEEERRNRNDPDRRH